MEWARLVAGSATGRRVIYSERFPARWDELEAEVGSLDFTEHEAGQLLTVFASHWDLSGGKPRGTMVLGGPSRSPETKLKESLRTLD